MLVSLKWLEKHLDTTASVSEIVERLTMIGLEVEEVKDPSADLAPFIIGEIKTVIQHPNADRLKVLTVWTGTETLQIVCGAPNVRVGLKSILARPGDIIPKLGTKLEKGVIRGVESQGMMCAEDELNLGEDHTGIIELETELPAGTPITDVIKTDVILDVNVTPNRPDCLGIRGIARDLAATGIGTFIPEKREKLTDAFPSPIHVSITDKACHHFVGRYIRGVKNGESPTWLKELLLSVGLRPISALVDITNYLSIGACRPLHVFDADKIVGNLVIRSAQNGEKMMALDDKEYTLSEGMTVIADDNGVQSIAGVMGGTATAVTAETTCIFLESAFFTPESIARTGRLLNLVSDARTRFEHGVDPASCRSGNDLATQLILELCGGEASAPVEAGSAPTTQPEITFDFGLVEKICALSIPREEMVSILQALGFEVDHQRIRVPSWRVHDIKQPIDLVEEIVRIHGLNNLPEMKMRSETLPTGMLLPHQKRESIVRRTLAARDLNQAITWSFMDSRLAQYFGSKNVRIANPISSDLDEMRPSLIPNLLSAVKRNQDYGIKDVQLFEVGPEFYSAIPGEQRMVAAGVRAGSWTLRHFAEATRPVDVFDAKADAWDALCSMNAPQNLQVFRNAPSWYHPGRSGSFQLGKNIVAVFGEIHPSILKVYDIKTPVVAFEVYMDALPLPKPKGKTIKPLKLSNLTPLTRDFAFVMDKSVDAAKVIASIQNVNRDLISHVSVFDVYEGEHLPEGKKQLAFQVVIQPVDKTLTDKEIEILSTQIINLVSRNTGATLRS